MTRVALRQKGSSSPPKRYTSPSGASKRWDKTKREWSSIWAMEEGPIIVEIDGLMSKPINEIKKQVQKFLENREEQGKVYSIILVLGKKSPTGMLEDWIDEEGFYFCHYPDGCDTMSSSQQKTKCIIELLGLGETIQPVEPAIDKGNPDPSFWEQPGGLDDQDYAEFLKILGS